MAKGQIQIECGRVTIDGKVTTNPELIGYAILDLSEALEEDDSIILDAMIGYKKPFTTN